MRIKKNNNKLLIEQFHSLNIKIHEKNIVNCILILIINQLLTFLTFTNIMVIKTLIIELKLN